MTDEPYFENENVKLWLGNFFNINFPDNEVDFIITSPRYNVGIDYKNNFTDMTSPDDYITEMVVSLINCWEALKPGGHIAYIMPMYVSLNNKTVPPELWNPHWKNSYVSISYLSHIIVGIDNEFKQGNYEHPLWLVGSIPWIKTGGVKGSQVTSIGSIANKPHPVNGWELMTIWRKGFGDRNNRKGLIPDSRFMSLMSQPWRVNAETKNVQHPVPYPKELVARALECFTFEGETVFDPFMGSGTTGIVALKMNRKFWGVDISEQYIENSMRRMNLKYTELKRW